MVRAHQMGLLPQERILLLFIQRYFTNEANFFSTLEATCQSDTLSSPLKLESPEICHQRFLCHISTNATCKKKSRGTAGFSSPVSRHESSLYSERTWNPNLNQIQSSAAAVDALFLQTHLEVWKCGNCVIVNQEAKMSSNPNPSHLQYFHHCT